MQGLTHQKVKEFKVKICYRHIPAFCPETHVKLIQKTNVILLIIYFLLLAVNHNIKQNLNCLRPILKLDKASDKDIGLLNKY